MELTAAKSKSGTEAVKNKLIISLYAFYHMYPFNGWKRIQESAQERASKFFPDVELKKNKKQKQISENCAKLKFNKLVFTGGGVVVGVVRMLPT